jgi:hypothetical protein
MLEAAAGTVTTQTDPTPSANTPAAPAVDPAAPGTPAPATGTLLGGDPKPEGDPKPADPAPAGDPKPAEPAKPEGAPEKYEFKAPEGKEYDPQVIESFSTAAKDANLTQEAAQKLIDSMAPALAQRQQAQVEEIHKGWVEASKTDKEFGGEKLSENLAVAKKAYDQFSTPELRDLMEKSHLGDHPEMLRFMYRVGKAISEDKFVGGSAAATEPDIAKRLFPNQA